MQNKRAVKQAPSFGSLSEAQTRLLGLAEREGRRMIDSEFAGRVLGDAAKAAQVVSSLRRKGRLVPIVRGRYFVIPLSSPAGRWAPNEFLVARYWMGNTPYYLGYYTAYRYWRLTDQIPQETFVLNTRWSKRIRVAGLGFRAVKIDRRKYYGVMTIRIEDEEVRISDRERTLVDYVYRPVGTWTELVANVRQAARSWDVQRLVEYAGRFPVVSTRKRIGYLLQEAGVAPERLAPLWKSVRSSTKLVGLNPWVSTRRGRIDRKWGVIRNAV